tara:strand:- start:34 stop:1410 length:1377 start_codon:yes stop_codon:yes gene_type:complete
MQQSNQETYHSQTGEISIRTLAKRVIGHRWHIFGFTSFVTLLAIIYILISPTPPINYLATASFTSPSQSSVVNLNRFQLVSDRILYEPETAGKQLERFSEAIFSSFLKKIMTRKVQEKVFYENEYLTALNPENEPINVENYGSGFFGSISVLAPIKKDVNLLENAYLISMQGSDAEIISRFLNQLVASADKETVNDYISLGKKKIDIRLAEIALERDLLLSKAKQDRLAKIQKIKEEDAQKIRDLNDQIDRARYKAKQNRLNQIQTLASAAQLAGSLGIVENNLGQISENNNEIDLNIENKEDMDQTYFLPEWYLFGEKALLERVEILKNRTNDDPFISKLVTLNNEINEIQNNNLLQTLKEREDDSPFITRINKNGEKTNLISELDAEKTKLELTIIKSSDISAIQLTQPAKAVVIPKKPSKKMIVAIALFASFMFSIFLALLSNLLEEDETESTTK